MSLMNTVVFEKVLVELVKGSINAHFNLLEFWTFFGVNPLFYWGFRTFLGCFVLLHFNL